MVFSRELCQHVYLSVKAKQLFPSSRLLDSYGTTLLNSCFVLHTFDCLSYVPELMGVSIDGKKRLGSINFTRINKMAYVDNVYHSPPLPKFLSSIDMWHKKGGRRNSVSFSSRKYLIFLLDGDTAYSLNHVIDGKSFTFYKLF